MTGKTNKATILAAARNIVERDGIESLTMRGLASAMDTKPMTLYYHIPNKEALVAELLDQAAAEIPWTRATGTPSERMISIVTEMAHRLGEIDWIVSALRIATHVGVPAMTLENQFIDAAREIGASDQQALDTWRSCWYLVSSELLWRRNVRTRTPQEAEWHQSIAPEQLEEFPTVKELLPNMAEFSANYNLETAIKNQIHGAIGSFTRI